MDAWAPITDLEGIGENLASQELASLRGVWREQRDLLQADGLLDRYTERLSRNWAIETGILERLYTLDRGVTTLMLHS